MKICLKKLLFTPALIAGLLLAMAGSLAAQTNLVVNGGFESGSFSGWTVGGDFATYGYNYVTNDPSYVHSGTYGAELGTLSSVGYLSQTLATTPGVTYLISCWLNGDGFTPNAFQVSWDATTLISLTNFPATGGWTNYQFSITATGTNTLLKFGLRDDETYLGFDDVSVTAITNLVANGGFETGDFTGWTTGGNFTYNSVVTNAADAHSGTYGAQMGESGTLGYLSQTLPTMPGQAYLVSFWLYGDGFLDNEFHASWNGSELVGITNLPGVGWTNIQFIVTATGSSTVLQFGFRNDLTYLGFDDVSVAPASNLIANGGFETGDFSGWAEIGDFTYNTVVTNSQYAYSGTYGAQMGSGGALSYLTQTVPTAPGTTYLVSLWLNCDGFTPNEFQASWNGSVKVDLTNLSNVGWTNIQFAVVATGASATVQFGFRNDVTYLGFDDVSVTVLPVTNLLVNNGFETGDYSGWTAIGDFSFTSIDTNSQFAHSGTYGAKTGGVGSPCYFAQTVETVAGAQYQVSCWVNFDGFTPNEFRGVWNGTALVDLTNVPALGWTNIQFMATGTGGSVVVQFGFRDDLTYLGFDDASVLFASLPSMANPPQLAITNAGANVILTWPSSVTGFTLQSATNLITGGWSTVSPAPVVIGGQNTVTNAITGPQQFYRLIQN